MKLTLATNKEVNILHSRFKKFNTHLLEDPSKLYNNIGIMDVYNRVLTEEEASKLLGRDHNLKLLKSSRSKYFSKIVFTKARHL